MCGRPVDRAEASPGKQPPAAAAPPARSLFPTDKKPRPLAWLFGFFLLVTLCAGGYAFLRPDRVPLVLVASPTPEPIAQAPTFAATTTATPTATPTTAATETPTETPTPLPTDTPQPPRLHRIESGQTLIGLAQLYGITLDSIQTLNGFDGDSILFAGQEVQIPWPTATPPLQAIAFAVGEETIVIDPSNCPPFYEIQSGDSLFFIASQNDVPLDALMEINFLTLDSILRPGDIICVPRVIEGGFLPPTPGPSPTPSPTAAPQGPRLLFPPDKAELPGEAGVQALQWLAVKDLAPDEWYMVELVDLSDVDALPRRGFTRANSFQLQPQWQPADPHRFQWQVSIVRVTGRRADGGFIYTYGGRSSRPRTITWPGS